MTADAVPDQRLRLGTADSIVPLAAVRRIPHCVLTELAGAGHLRVSVHHTDVLAWLASVMLARADATRKISPPRHTTV